MNEQTELKLPTYVSHKRVQAAQIVNVSPWVEIAAGKVVGRILILQWAGAPRKEVECKPELFSRYTPIAGDYYVVYEDGYISISPKAAFEGGYNLEG